MGFALTATAAFIMWIVLWAIGAKSFDAFLVTVTILVVAATIRILARYIPGRGA